MALLVDGQSLVAHPYINVEPGAKALRRLKGKGVLGSDDPSYIIRKATVGIGYIACALQDHDLRGLVQPAEPGGLDAWQPMARSVEQAWALLAPLWQ